MYGTGITKRFERYTDAHDETMYETQHINPNMNNNEKRFFMMTALKRSLSLCMVAVAGAVVGPSPAALAALVPPDFCSAFMDGAVFNDKGAYCVSNFGWSDTWYSVGLSQTFPPFPASYDQATDLFSGDDSPNLRFRDEFGTLLSGTGWLSPIMDAGALFPSYNTTSAWQVGSPLAYVGSGTDTLESSIFYVLAGGQLDVKITTHIKEDGQVVQTFDITNNSSIALTDLFFSDYFNLHPNGSTAAATQVGSTQFDGTGCSRPATPVIPVTSAAAAWCWRRAANPSLRMRIT